MQALGLKCLAFVPLMDHCAPNLPVLELFPAFQSSTRAMVCRRMQHIPHRVQEREKKG